MSGYRGGIHSQRCNILSDPPLVSCQATGEVYFHSGVTFWMNPPPPNTDPSHVSCSYRGGLHLQRCNILNDPPQHETLHCDVWGYRGGLHLQRCNILNDPPTPTPNRPLASCSYRGGLHLQRCNILDDPPPTRTPPMCHVATGEVYIYSGVTFWMTHPPQHGPLPCVM